MKGTFYINSAMVGTSGYYMTWAQIHDIYNAGHEIGGHTLHHTNLTKVSAATATTEVCDDRTNLINQGFPVTSFAYPEAAVNATAEQIVRDCGYTSGRGVGNLFGPSCPCAYAETTPPRDAYNLRTAEPGTSTSTLADLQASVTNAENHGGGWVSMVFHGICDNNCTSTNSLSPSLLNAFLDWLQARSGLGTVVRTVGQAMNPVPAYPTTMAACDGGSCSPWFRTTPVTVALSATDTGGPGVASTYYTTDGTDPRSSPSRISYGGPFPVGQTTTVKSSSTDAAGGVEPPVSQLVRIDAAAPTVTVTSPANGASISRGTKVTITANAGDTGTGSGAASGIANVAIYIDGVKMNTDVSAPYTFLWGTRKKALGQHQIWAVATDVATNQTTSSSVIITLTR